MGLRLSYTFAILVHLLYVHEGSGLTCLSCNGITHPRNCDVTAKCDQDEVCYAASSEAHDGIKAYHVGCTRRNNSHVCSAKSSSFQCSECCDSDLCNSQLCGEQGYPALRGPICYSCRSRLVNEPCNIIDFCYDGEVCGISEKHSFSDVLYTSGCIQKHECDLHHHGHMIVGKRLVHLNVTEPEDDLIPGNCQRCCNKDLCNVACTSYVSSIDECTSFPCSNGGSCTSMGVGFTCVCAPGYTGKTCNIDINECDTFPCLNGGTCVDMVNGYDCLCAPGYNGTKCDKDINECDTFPCLNGGTCVDMVNGYDCLCAPGYNGTECDKDINECDTFPCLNGGTCVDMVNGYDCLCAPGYNGTKCDKDINECDTFPCLNGGTCVDMVNGYDCLCAPGYNGTKCDKDVNECDTFPCLNGGTCVNRANGYDCLCAPGYNGTKCDKVWDCLSLLQMGNTKSGVYQIFPPQNNHTIGIDVFCDMTTDGGGWTVFQKRINGSVNFFRNHTEYENGFGNVDGEFWLGLRSIYQLSVCAEVDLRIDLGKALGFNYYEVFDHFSVSAAPKYTLHVGRGNGTINDTHGLTESNGYDFYTFDHDNGIRCARHYYSAWWYDESCGYNNLNGLYWNPPGREYPGDRGNGMFSYDVDAFNTLKSTTMMLRRRGSLKC